MKEPNGWPRRTKMNKITVAIFATFFPFLAFAQQVKADSTWRTIAIEILLLAPLAVLAIHLKRKQSKKNSINEKPLIFATTSQPISANATAQIITCSNQRFLLIQNKSGHLALTPIHDEQSPTQAVTVPNNHVSNLPNL